MTTYSVQLVRYDRKGGIYDVGTMIRSMDAARKCAYDAVAHKGLNVRGEFKALIFRNDYPDKIYEGELMNTADDERFWYPITYRMGKSKYRKYTVRKDGSLGKGMW